MRQDRRMRAEEDLAAYRRHNDPAAMDFAADQDLRRADRGRAAAQDSARAQAVLMAVVAAVLSLVLFVSLFGVYADWKASAAASDIAPYSGYSYEGLVRSWWLLDEYGAVVDGPFEDEAAVPEPAWHAEAAAAGSERPAFPAGVCAAVVAVAAFAGWAATMQVRFGSAYSGDVTDDLLNDNRQDGRVALPSDLDGRYDWFPDAGASVDKEITAILSHSFFTDTGVKRVAQARRAEATDAETGVMAGEELYDDDGDLLCDSVPIIDASVADRVFDAYGVGGRTEDSLGRRIADSMPDNAVGRTIARALRSGGDAGAVRRLVDPENTVCRDGRTLAKTIEQDWEFDPEEPARPAGGYRVTDANVHVAITAASRSGKTQNYILALVDCLRRQAKQPNMIVNDMKGQILRNYYAVLEHSGYDIRQLNFFSPAHSDIINPLQNAAESMADGRSAEATSTMLRIAQCFFPKAAGDDSFWSDAARNCYMMLVWMLVDLVLRRDEDIFSRRDAGEMTDSEAQTASDKNWGALSFKNVYGLFRIFASERVRNPANVLKDEAAALRERAARMGQDDPRAVGLLRRAAELDDRAANEPCAELWGGKPSLDMLSVYTAALRRFPEDRVREQVRSAGASIDSMKDSEKTIASIYGVASTQMQQFDDENLAYITSGRRSQNLDINSLSFPKRISLRFESSFIRSLKAPNGVLCEFDAYEDDRLERPMGPEFHHAEEVDVYGWVSYIFSGDMPDEAVYIRCTMRDPQRHVKLRDDIYLAFRKGYRTKAEGKILYETPFTRELVVEGGSISEMLMEDGRLTRARSTFSGEAFDFSRLDEMVEAFEDDGDGEPRPFPRAQRGEICRISELRCAYTERPKAIFFLVDLSKTQFLPVLLVYLHQQFDANVSQAYTKKADQLPQRATYYILDEAGNLRNGNMGIPDLGIKFSLGLEQQQRFTMVWQDKSQLDALYDKDRGAIDSNTLVELFLKVKEEDVIQEVSKRSGIKHEVHSTSRTHTRDRSKPIGKTKSEVTEQESVVEEPVISANAIKTMEMGQAIVFDSGAWPIFNKLDTVLPPDYLLRERKIEDPYNDYTPITIPSSTGTRPDTLEELAPDWYEVFNRTLELSAQMEDAKEIYRMHMGIPQARFKGALDRDRDRICKTIVRIAGMLADRRRESDASSGFKPFDYASSAFVDEEFAAAVAEAEGEAAEHAVDTPVPEGPQVLFDDGDGHALLDRDLTSGEAAPFEDGTVDCVVFACERVFREGLENGVTCYHGQYVDGSVTILERRSDAERHEREIEAEALGRGTLERDVADAAAFFRLTPEGARWLALRDWDGVARGRLAEEFDRAQRAVRPETMGWD